MKQIVLSSALLIALMIGTSSAFAKQDFFDSQGRSCTFGPSHDECLYELEKIPGTTNYRDYHSGYKVGYNDGLNDGIYHHSKAEDNVSASFTSGYTAGWGKGCDDSGRTEDDCSNQEDVSTP